MSKRKVSYFYDPDVGAYTYGLGHLMKPHRMRITHELAMAYGMLDKMNVLRPKRASPEAMTVFHTDEYIHFLENVTPETAERMTNQRTRFLVGDDNPAFEGVFEFCSISAGGSISAAEHIASGASDIAINWAGGLHHAHKREAAGFCYINDIVLGILELLRTFPRVLYIDIDCHHGDGVEEAFYTTDRVMTCSLHKFGEFFPGTGTHRDIGAGKGKGYSVNVPLKDGITDETFQSVFDPIISKIMEVFRPSVVVLQCGADSLAGDKLGCLNLSMHGHAHCVQFMRQQNVPLILLGGGGYTVKNVAKTWTYETACAIGIENDIDPNLPWSQYFEWFGPTYRLEVPENNMEDMNVKDGYIDDIRRVVLEQLQKLDGPPSVQMQDVPRDSLGRHLGFAKVDQSKDELDEQLAQHSRYLYNLQSSDSFAESDDSETSDSDDNDSTSSVNPSDWRRSPFGGRRSASAASSRVNTRFPSQPPPYIPSSERKRMSIITGKYFDIPAGDESYAPYDVPVPKSSKRRFFQSGLTDIWEDSNNVDAIVDAHLGVINGFGSPGFNNLSSVLERRESPEISNSTEEEDEGEEDEEDDVAMSVDF